MSLRVVVAGASRGLGYAFTRRYLETGHEVWAGCRRPEMAADLGTRGAHVLPLDVCDQDSIEAFAEAIGERAVDVLINAAGIDARAVGARADKRGPFDLSPQHFLAEMQVNAVGPMLVTRSLLAALTRSPQAKIVNLSSRTGSMSVGAEVCWDIGYNASKAALNAITVRTATLLAGHKIIVVAMHPGWVRTDMGGSEADLEPEQAVEQLIATITHLTPDDSGAFLQPDGAAHPW